MSRGRRVENDHVVLHLLDFLHELREGERLVDSGERGRQIADQIVQFVAGLFIHSRHAEHLLEVYCSFEETIQTILRIRLDLHAVQIRETVDKEGMARELLLEGVTRRSQAKGDGAYLRLCAGSVEMIRTLFLVFVSCTAREQDVVVLPTPPFPPTKILLLMKKRHAPPLQFLVLYDVSQRRFGDIALVFHGRRILCVQRVFVCG